MNPQGDTNHDIRGSLWHRWDLHFHTPREMWGQIFILDFVFGFR